MLFRGCFLQDQNGGEVEKIYYEKSTNEKVH